MFKPEKISEPDYWRRLCPFLSIAGKSKDAGCKENTESRAISSNSEASRARRYLNDHGFVAMNTDLRVSNFLQLGSDKQVSHYKSLIAKLQRAAHILVIENGWPCTFLGLYDEVWELAELFQTAFARMTSNKNMFVYDMVGFFAQTGGGFSPHRDRQPEQWQLNGNSSEDPRSTFDPETGIAKYLTAWIALSDALPENSCLHFVDAQADPGYHAGDDADCEKVDLCDGQSSVAATSESIALGEMVKEPMARVFFNRNENFQKIRSAPVRQGQFTIHTHRVIHWGSTGDIDFVKKKPRISYSFAFANNASGPFEPAYIAKKQKHFESLLNKRCNAQLKGHEKKTNSKFYSKSDGLVNAAIDIRLTDFQDRVSLCAAQVVNYSTLAVADEHGWKTFAGEKIRNVTAFYKLFKQREHIFHPTYKAEIRKQCLRKSGKVFSILERIFGLHSQHF